MSKYIVKVEATDSSVELTKEFIDGIPCDGFVICADKGNGSSVAIHDVTLMDIAAMIGETSKLMSAAHIAKAMREAKAIERESELDGIKMALIDSMKDR